MLKKLFLILIIIIFIFYICKSKIEKFKNNKKIKIAICFFGLCRSLNYTLDSIKNNILLELKNNNIEYDIILHTYNLKYLNLKRSNESYKLDTNEWKLLKPDKFKIDNQDEFDKKYDYNYIKSFGDAWNTNYENTINLIRQLNSLKKVWSLCHDKNNKYDCYLFLRPDIKYLNKINTDYVNNIVKNNNLIYTPEWLKSGGLNDRFALCDYNSAKIYSNRIDNIPNYLSLTKKPLHAEKFLKFVINKNNILNKDLNLKGHRIRSKGNVPYYDLKYVKI